MSLITRKRRPLARDLQSFRDDRLFIVACDDTHAPKQYFEFFKISRVQVHVVPTEDGTSVAKHVLNRLLKFEHYDDDELWMLLDTDHVTEGRHLPGFLSALSEARQKGIMVALSKPCFELWLLLHHVEASEVKALANAREVEVALRETLGEYNKTNLKAAHFSLEAVAKACRRAKCLDEAVEGGEIPAANTTRVYQLWKAVVGKALSSQLPAQLAECN